MRSVVSSESAKREGGTHRKHCKCHMERVEDGEYSVHAFERVAGEEASRSYMKYTLPVKLIEDECSSECCQSERQRTVVK